MIVSRITKYPLLIEPLIKTAKDRPEEQQKLKNCLHLVKSILVNVNGQVIDQRTIRSVLKSTAGNRQRIAGPVSTSTGSNRYQQTGINVDGQVIDQRINGPVSESTYMFKG